MAQTPEVRNLAGPPLERPMFADGKLDTTWQRWFIDLWNRTGGASGDNIYTGLILGQIADIEKNLNSRMADFESLLSGAVAQFVLNLQQEIRDAVANATVQLGETAQQQTDDAALFAAGLLQQVVTGAAVQSVFGRQGAVVAQDLQRCPARRPTSPLRAAPGGETGWPG